MVPRIPSSDIIRPDSDASISILPSIGKSMDDILGPLSDLSEGQIALGDCMGSMMSLRCHVGSMVDNGDVTVMS